LETHSSWIVGFVHEWYIKENPSSTKKVNADARPLKVENLLATKKILAYWLSEIT